MGLVIVNGTNLTPKPRYSHRPSCGSHDTYTKYMPTACLHHQKHTFPTGGGGGRLFIDGGGGGGIPPTSS